MQRKVLLSRGVCGLRLQMLLLFILTTLGVQAQMGKLFDADKQMSSSFTTQIYIDHDGFIWVATRNGLNRYDGYQFRILKKETRRDMGMASNYVNCIMQDHNGLFYIGMYGALQTYDGQYFHDVCGPARRPRGAGSRHRPRWPLDCCACHPTARKPVRWQAS